MIFIQIASYRDPMLEDTMASAIQNAAYPEELSFGVAWQFGPDEVVDFTQFGINCRVTPIPHNESKGACWARAKANELHAGEEYVLQIDSHMQFAKGWDVELLAMISELPEKSILTTYAPAFRPATGERVMNPWVMNIDRWSEGLWWMRPGYSNHTEPLPTALFSGHFAFGPAQWIKDVPYDSELYFSGEEHTMALRLFTHGYTLYHPHRVVIWHEYTREGRSKHWDDDGDWWKIDKPSKDKARAILRGDVPELLGNERTVSDYYKFLIKHNLNAIKKQIQHR